MAETKQEVRTYRVDMTCDDCKLGMMRPTGMTLTRNPPLYVHRCSNCDRPCNYERSYPHFVCEVKQ